VAATAILQKSQSFTIRGAEGNPLEIPAGEYYFNTKERARRMMQNSLSSEARQVYACLEMGTMGFQQELAVMMDRGRKRPITPDDISTQTGLSRQNTRRALTELEDQGLAERRADDDGDLRKGHVTIYSWAVPREPKCKPDCSRALTTIPDWFPESWAPIQAFIKRHKLRVVIDQATAETLLEEGMAVARDYKEAEIVVARFADCICAPTNLYKEERTERTRERTVSQSVSSVLEVATEDLPTDNFSSDRQKEPEPERLTPAVSAIRTVAIDPLHKAVYAAIPIELFVKLQDLPSPALLTEMYLKLAGAPPEHLTQKIRQRWDSIRSLGLLANLAQDVGDAFKRLEVQIPATVQSNSPPATGCAAYLEIPDDPVVKETVCLKCRGKTLEYQSGYISWCKCESEKRAGGNG
jgi:DNA-binding transcriptional ArsR family regulator